MDQDSLFNITYGLYVISSIDGDRANGFIGNAVMQVTATPSQLVISSSKDNYTTSLIEKSGLIAISALTQATKPNTIKDFGYKSGRDINKFASATYELTPAGIPYLKEECCAWFDCRVVNTTDLGTHLLFLCEITNAQIVETDSEPLTYRYLRDVLKAKSPKSAPTYVDPKKNKNTNPIKDTKMNEKYVCDVCGYVYDPAAGDPDNGVAANTPFDALPSDWACPLCAVDTSNFSKE